MVVKIVFNVSGTKRILVAGVFRPMNPEWLIANYIKRHENLDFYDGSKFKVSDITDVKVFPKRVSDLCPVGFELTYDGKILKLF